MKFSIITPSFNQGRFIGDCIESVLAQTEVEVEHIIRDAGSTDETLEVLAKYPHLKWSSEPDRGMSDGINKGFRQANGDWLMWLNCDDYLLPSALAKIAEHILKNQNADVVYADCVFVDESKNLIERKYGVPANAWTIYASCHIPSTSAFYKKRIIDAGELVNIDYKLCMDWEFYLRLLRKGYAFSYMPEAIAGFRWHDSNTSILIRQSSGGEAPRLRREHIRELGLPAWLCGKTCTVIYRYLMKAARMIQRFKIHRKFL